RVIGTTPCCSCCESPFHTYLQPCISEITLWKHQTFAHLPVHSSMSLLPNQALWERRTSSNKPSSTANNCSTKTAKSIIHKMHLGHLICDTILGHTRGRFSFTSYLVGAVLLDGEPFDLASETVPEEALNTTVRTYLLPIERVILAIVITFASPEKSVRSRHSFLA
ncbi:hypothetical protein AMECASPLE_036690, partial [Ameca splendens]